jgi:hypothetical protein
MMSHVNGNTSVFIWLVQNGQRHWISKVDNIKDTRLDKLVLTPTLDDDPHLASSFSYQAALIIRRRLLEERPTRDIRFALTPTGEEIATGGMNSAPDKDNRVVMHYRGFIFRPHIPSGWCLRLHDGPRQLESVRSDTIEDCYLRAEERNLLKFAERAPEPPAPEPVKEIYNGPVIRPGDRS